MHGSGVRGWFLAMKTKIVIVVEAMLGGIRQHVCDIVKNLNQEQYDVYLIYSDLRADEVFFAEIELLSTYASLIKCNEMCREIGKNDFIAYKKLVSLFSDIQPDIVHCHSSKAGIVGRLAARKCKVRKIIYTPNAYSFQSPDVSRIKKRIYIFAERFLSIYATTMTINVSKGEMQQALDKKLDKPNKFVLIYNGIPNIELPDKNELKKRLGLKEEIYYIGVTARCAKQKDPMTFLRIAERVVSETANVEFIYIGDGPLQQEMKVWIEDRGLGDRIHLFGFRMDASEMVGALDIYLSTAQYEGLPYSMIEATRAGVPIIATDVVGNNEIVFSSINGMMFSAKDIQNAVLLIHKQLTEKVIKSKQAKEIFFRKFLLSSMIKKTSLIYSSNKSSY